MYDVISLAGALLAVVFVLLLAYCFSRALGKTWIHSSRGNTIQIAGQLQIGADRHLLLVRPEDTQTAERSVDRTFADLLRTYASSRRTKKEKDHE